MNRPCDYGRGQVGIGTLIIFIAVILVATITAGTLIEITGFLQGQTRETGEETGEQVSDSLEVIAVTGDHINHTEPRSVGVVNITVKKAPGSGDIDLEDVTVQWIGPAGAYDVVATTATTTTDGEFHVTALQDEDGSVPILNDPDDRAVLTLDVGKDNFTANTELGATATFGQNLNEGTQARVEITTGSGSSTDVHLLTPRSLSGEEAVEL